MGAERASILDVQGLKTYFPIKKGFLRRTVGWVRAVDGVSFSIGQGETVSLVGESGCGKSTTAKSVVRVHNPQAGSVAYRTRDGETVDVMRQDAEGLRRVRKEIRMIFQDPFQSLNPRMTVLDIVGEPLRNYGVAEGQELRDRVAELLRQVGLDPKYLGRYPHAFSGGQRQRIGIARALALGPRLLLADEPTSALDVSVQAQILNLMQALQNEHGLSYLFITHELGIVRHFSDRSGVMYVGKLVEMGDTKELFARPRHPYTEALLSAAPVPDPKRKSDRIILPGEVPDPAHVPAGCPFHPRCLYAKDVCRGEAPELRPLSKGDTHAVACHFAGTLELRGARW